VILKITKKICMLGDFSVGKTSLVRQFVRQSFSDKYLTTVGVKVDTKVVSLDAERQVKFVLWDVAGEKSIGPLQRQYLKGMAGYMLVVDGTRLPTLTSAKTIQQQIVSEHGDLPFCLLVNKQDLVEQLEITPPTLEQNALSAWTTFFTSAKTGAEVETAFDRLAEQMVNGAKSN